jgi:hypothetical protein
MPRRLNDRGITRSPHHTPERCGVNADLDPLADRRRIAPAELRSDVVLADSENCQSLVAEERDQIDPANEPKGPSAEG